MSRAALDTNVLVSAQGLGDARRIAASRSLIARLPQGALVVPVQALGELFRVLIRKGGVSPSDAAKAIEVWRAGATIQDTTVEVMERAVEIACAHGLYIWDGVMLAASQAAGCQLLLSEDLQDGFARRGVTVSNPFAPGSSAALLNRFLARGTP